MDSQPGPIVITPDGKTGCVANANSGTVTPIQTATNTVLKPIKVGSTPAAMVIAPDGETHSHNTQKGIVVTATTLGVWCAGDQPERSPSV